MQCFEVFCAGHRSLEVLEAIALSFDTVDCDIPHVAMVLRPGEQPARTGCGNTCDCGCDLWALRISRILDWLFLGDLADATDLELLDSRGIGAVLNLIGPGAWNPWKCSKWAKCSLSPMYSELR